MTDVNVASLGDRSYLAHDGQVAIVVDPQRDIDRIPAPAGRLGVRITHVAETHADRQVVHIDDAPGAGLSIVPGNRTGAPHHMTTPTSIPAALDVSALQHLLTTGQAPRLIDVRTPAEFETAHIPGSYNVPLDLLREHRDELRDHLDEQVVLVCRSGQRAAQAEQALAGAGLPNLRVLTGGIAAWQADQASVTTGASRWDLERQVRLVAGSIVLLAVLASILVEPVKWVAGFIGASLTFAALTNTCAMGVLLAKLPYNRGPRTDLEQVVAALGTDRR